MKRNQKIFFFILFISIVLLVTACGADEDSNYCKKKSDCTDEDKDFYKISCEDNECEYTPIPDKCGNGQCEGAEKCDGCVDCIGDEACEGKEGYLTKKCNNKDQCMTSVEEFEAKEQSENQNILFLGPAGELAIEMAYEEPFNLDASSLRVKVSLSKKDDKVNSITLKKIEVIEGKGKDETSIGKLDDIGKTLFATDTEILEDIRLDVKLEENQLERKSSARVKFTFVTEGTNPSTKKPQTQDLEFEKEIKQLIFVDPTINSICDSRKCNDNNPCTKDSCYTGTGVCQHEMKTGACKGNFKCDAGENECTAPTDCGSCSGKVTASTEKACVNNKCEIVVSSQTAVEHKKLTEEKDLPNPTTKAAKFKITKEYNQPFTVGSDTFKITLEVLDIPESTSNLQVTGIELKDGQLEIGQASASGGFTKVGDTKSFEIGISHKYPDKELKKNPQLRLKYEFDGKDPRGEPKSYKNQVYETTFSQVTILNVG